MRPVKVPVEVSWTFAPVVILALLAYVAIYGARWKRVQAAPGRLALWILGVALIGTALLSPVDHLGEQLASAHMIQHLLLADLAPIALILALTKVILRPVTRRVHEIEKRAGVLAHPAMGVIAYVGAMWLWHVPALYDAAVEHPVVHVLEHVSFAAAGGLYWWHLLSPIRSRLRLGGMGPILYMASTKILVGFLGVLLAFAPDRLYDAYGRNETATRWGMNVLDDQHVAGLIMGLEQSIVMGIGLAFLFSRMLTESEAEEQRAERYESV
jgi:cytochrome c oxidase assembly factor CtaG